MWKDFNTTFKPKEIGQFFMVRVKGLHSNTGNKYVPIVAQMIDGCLYEAHNEIEPIQFTGDLDSLTITNDPFKANLEWLEIPE